MHKANANLHQLVSNLSGEEAIIAEKFIMFLMNEAGFTPKKIEVDPLDERRLKPEFIKTLKKAEKDIKLNKTITLNKLLAGYSL